MSRFLAHVINPHRRTLGQGGIAHAQLILGPGMIMLGSVRAGDDPFGRIQQTPGALGGTTQSPYVVVPDADEVYRRARAAGAKIAIDIKEEAMAVEAFPASTPKAISGTSAPTIPGGRRPEGRPQVNRGIPPTSPPRPAASPAAATAPAARTWKVVRPRPLRRRAPSRAPKETAARPWPRR
jgi:hypothetical protein